jgi:hypothetical protein
VLSGQTLDCADEADGWDDCDDDVKKESEAQAKTREEPKSSRTNSGGQDRDRDRLLNLTWNR